MSPSTSTLSPTSANPAAYPLAHTIAGNQGGVTDPRTNGPIRKSTWSLVVDTLPSEHVAYVWLDMSSGALNFISAKDGARYGKAALPLLRDAIESVYWAPKESAAPKYSAVVFADSKTLRTAARQLIKAKDAEARYDGFSTAGRRMEFMTHLRQGYRFVTLTDALAHTHRHPADPTSIDSWADLFGVKTDALGLSKMFRSMDSPALERPAETIRNLNNSERNAVSLSVFPDPSSTCRCYDAAEALQSNQSSLAAFDPSMREANVAAGVLTKVSFQTRRSGKVVVRADTTCNLRVGSEVAIIEPGRSNATEGRISEMDFIEDTLRVTIDHRARDPLMTGSETSHKPAYMMAKPFTAQSYARSGADWVQENTGARVADREVPLSIMLAGAP